MNQSSPRDEKPSTTPDADPAAPETSSEELSYSGLILPVVSSVLVLSLVFFFYGGDATLELFTTAVATATVAGKFIVLRGLHQEGFLDSPFKLGFLVVYLDLMVASIAVYNIGVLYKIPRFGKKIAAMQENGRGILKRNPWMRKVTFAGIVAFVMFPFSGTGAIGGALFGRLLGMTRLRTMIGIGIGACCGAFGMAGLARLFGDQMSNIQGNPALLVGGLAAVGLVVWVLIRNNKRAAARRAELAAQAASDAEEAEAESESVKAEYESDDGDEMTAGSVGGSTAVEVRPQTPTRPARRS